MRCCPARYPTEWRQPLVSQGIAICWFAISMFTALQSLNTGLVFGMNWVIVILLCMAFYCGVVSLLVFFCQVRFFGIIEAITWGILALAAAILPATSPDVVWRHRAQASCCILMVALPLYFGMPFRVFLSYVSWVAVLNAFTLQSFAWLHGEVVPIQMYITGVLLLGFSV